MTKGKLNKSIGDDISNAIVNGINLNITISYKELLKIGGAAILTALAIIAVKYGFSKLLK